MNFVINFLCALAVFTVAAVLFEMSGEFGWVNWVVSVVLAVMTFAADPARRIFKVTA